MMARAVGITSLAAIGLTGCAAERAGPRYQLVDMLRIDRDLIDVVVEVEGVEGPQDASDYGRCVAARYALDNGFGFARHIRTETSKTGGKWRADAVYNISPVLPEGRHIIDNEIAVQTCAEREIPTG